MDVAAKRAAIHGTDLPDLKGSLDSLAVLEETMRHFYIKAKVEQSLGEKADWKATQAADNKQIEVAERIVHFDGRLDFSHLSRSTLLAAARQIIRERVEKI
jgi:hypothetical protein